MRRRHPCSSRQKQGPPVLCRLQPAFGLLAEFRDNLNSIGIGIDGMFAWQPSHRIPVALGFDVGCKAYAMHAQRQTLYAEVKSGTRVISTFGNTLRVETASSIVDPQVAPAFHRSPKKVVPFVDAIFGFTYFRTGPASTTNHPVGGCRVRRTG